MNDNQATIETDAHMLGGSYSFDVEFARRLERERDEARAELEDWRNASKGAENPHPDEVHCTCVPLLHKLLKDVQNQLSRICKEGFDNQDTIGLEPADDYVLRKLVKLRAEVAVSNGERDHYRRENAEMRESIKEAHAALGKCLKYILRLPLSGSDDECETMDDAHHALRKLKPFLK